jgi:UDP-glucose 4-epimerase
VAEAIDGMHHVVFALGSLMPAEAEQEPQLDLSLTLQPLLELLGLLGDGPRLPLTYLSSGGTVYGRAQSLPIPETAPTIPLSAYGITRLAAERFVLRYGALHDADIRVLRIGNAYGTGQTTARGQGLVGTVLEKCRQEEPIVVYGDGHVSRDFVHVEDIGHAAAALVALPAGPPVVNIGSGIATSVREVLDLAHEVTGRAPLVIAKDIRDFDVPHVRLDISRLQALVDYRPRSLRRGMEQIWADMTAHGSSSADSAPVTRAR